MRSSDAAGSGDEVSTELAAIVARLSELAAATTDPEPDVSEAARIDRIALLESARGAVAAAQHTEIVSFARSHAEAQVRDQRIDPRRVGRGIAEQVALASRLSPSAGCRRLELARTLWAELPHTQELLAAGRISEELAAKIASETSHLDVELRRLVDKQLSGDDLPAMSVKEAAAQARRRAYDADREGYTARARKAREDRRVSVRPAPDTMAWLTLLLPVEQAVACRASLGKYAEGQVGHGDEDRTRDQVMADTAVERLTGHAAADAADVEVNLVIPVDALHPASDQPDTSATESTDDGEPATANSGPGVPELVGYGPIPMGIVRDILDAPGGKRWLRRLFTAPAGGPLIGGDRARRRFDGFVATLIGLRDHGHCRDPYCDAPIRHIDHIKQARAGGPTSYTNGRGVCERGNYTREMPDWDAEVIDDGLGGRPHAVRTTTPTGHTYTSRAGPSP